MKAKRGKRSEAFWPSIVMKKWLNIKPKVNDFSEDEVDTETESEDDACSLRGSRMREDKPSLRAQEIPSKFSTQRSDASSKGCKARHRRGKSETLRAQYINTKEVRVTIGTWNVAGRHPSEDLEIDDWLCTEDPADIYILGFQEVVPLNAGNVLGAEDNTPIPKWEAIIRRSLNKSSEPDSKHKSYSAPPSPVLRTSSAADLLADTIDVDNPIPIDMMIEEFVGTVENDEVKQHEVKSIIDIENNLQLRRIYGIDIDWPERSLDAIPQIVDSNSKLRRVLSSSARIGFNRTESTLKYSVGLKRSHHSSGNLGLLWEEQQVIPEVADSVSDLLSAEDDDAFVEMVNTEDDNELGTMKSCGNPRYVRIVSKQMVGIYVSVWVQRRLRRHINNLKVSPVGVGLMGYMGNKGSVSISMSLFQSRLCFVCSHLTSGQKEGAEHRRNSDVHEILRRTCFSPAFDADQPQTIPSHDQIFWFGDLNYRINMLDAEVRKLVALKKWNELMNYDQLSKELRIGRVFDGWKEGLINFPPTYKYEINSDRYVGQSPKEGEKRRSPAWCDRILWLGKGIKQLQYGRAEIKLSDHRPVSSAFLVEVEVFDHRKLKRALNFTRAAVHPEIFLDEDGEILEFH
ncbi:type I inositol polyphosphate 5-phosphatase 2-like [Vigna umbellata]|uniref:type I inositol polyphosphate 5-phosphatase 2-like n=1 Tax=Vigna umbellata TaxID=87088 RepID=UPI001F5F7F76|nr:type I inositol polyphosphate 5-phosphatase 2-like [Vigna umbellata]XP_047151633.1 type I inositol polyphosphate 5-phosphatase 2-like [Vigna umbellata]XP_047151634.1 type I inositol polyphosphate 5-phosphatase 2-like [Vigna umbellata]